MGEMIMQNVNSPWELIIVENAGTIPAENVKDEINVETRPLLVDVKAKLMTVPRSLIYTIGWRAVVWQNKETGQFHDLTEEEFEAYSNGGVVEYTRETNGTAGEVASTEGTTASSS